MAEVPQRQRALCVSNRRDGRHVGDRTRSVVDVREAHQSDRLIESAGDFIGHGGRGLLSCHNPQLAPPGTDDAFEDVEIGGEVGGIGDNIRPTGVLERRTGELEEVERGLVRDQDLAGPGSHERRQSITNAGGEAHPIGPPRSHQAGAPFLLNRERHRRDGAFGETAE